MAIAESDGAATTDGRRYYLEILLVSLAGLLLEVSYTRIFSYKIFYYYTYLVIGFALLGIGAGGVLVAISKRIKAATTASVIFAASLTGAFVIVIGYWIIARIPIDTTAIWDYGTGRSFANFGTLLLICLLLFAAFISIGVIVATLLGRETKRIGRLYFSDLLGAALACAVAVYLQASIGPPAVIFLCAAVLAVVAVVACPYKAGIARLAPIVTTIVLLVFVIANGLIPGVMPESSKRTFIPADATTYASGWGPVFRVDVMTAGADAQRKSGRPYRLLVHDGLVGSAIYKWDGNKNSLGVYDKDSRSLPFKLLGRDADQELIIGAAGGNEILASLHFGARDIDAVELNPVTTDFMRHKFADYNGHLTTQPGVHYINADGRTYIARSNDKYDLVWFVAPDSYAATNAASSGAFVLSESYLYTKEMIKKSLSHLTPDGVSVAQFGEFDFDHRPDRTTRYVVTAREAMAEMGIEHPEDHIAVVTNPSFIEESTIILKRTPFTPAELERLNAQVASLPGGKARYLPGANLPASSVTKAATLPGPALESFVDSYPQDISAVTDNSPFFWHFQSFTDVLKDLPHRIDAEDRENGIGERVLILLLGISALFALAFLLIPFWTIRKTWRKLPRKPTAFVYFAALGLGFMLFEITLIQKLVLFLGFPTYSLTVTLASLLVFTGIGALLSDRLPKDVRRAVPFILAVLVAITCFYQFALPAIEDSLITSSLGVRILVTFFALAPLGLCLGTFMPVGLRLVAGSTTESETYTAWGWAVNGVFSVVGSTLTTILSMTFGFTAVLWIALAVYLIAGLVLIVLAGHFRRAAIVA